MKRNSREANRRILQRYFAHFADRGNLTELLLSSPNLVWIVRGSRDEVGLDEADRNRLATADNVQLEEIADAGHFVMTDAPGEVAAQILSLLAER
jgi:pimeloyl-ACP methyl ester carboxylesterase